MESYANYFEYSTEKKRSKLLRFSGFLFRFGTAFSGFVLTVVLIVFLLDNNKAAGIVYLFASPMLTLMLCVMLIYFVNGFFYTGYDYLIAGGKLTITKINGNGYFGKTYYKNIVDRQISSLLIIAPFTDEYTDKYSKSDVRYDTRSCNDHENDTYFLMFEEGGKTTAVLFTATEKMLSLLKFYNGQNTFSA